MFSKARKIQKLLTSAMAAALMVFSLASPALAVPYSEGTSAQDPAKAAITKVFKLPVNTTIPESTFTFTFTKDGVNDDTDAATKAKMPDLGTNGSISVTFETGQTANFTDKGTQYFVKQTEDFLANIKKDGSDWGAGSGIYKYTVTENQSGITLTANTEDTEYPVYSKAAYEIQIWVEEDDDGVLFARYVVGHYIPGSPDEYYPEKPGEGKLDPTPGELKTGTPGAIDKELSQIIFTNRYWKTDGKTGTDPEKNALDIKKQVTGLNPDYDTYFEFNVTVITPEVADREGALYKAYVVDREGNFVNLNATGNPNNAAGTSTNPAATYIELDSDDEITVHLKHGERLIFFDLEVGSEVRVTEKIKTNVKVTYHREFSAKTPIDGFPMPVGTTGVWGFPRESGDKGPHYTKEVAGANVTTFVNNMSGNPPTGIAADDLPFVILLGILSAGLVGFVAVKARKARKQM